MSMNPEVKASWTAALRSGEYKQGLGALNRNERYCCLGVLCELAVKAGVASKHDRGKFSTEYGYLGSSVGRTGFLPQNVMAWAGLASDNPRLPDGTSFSVLNDSYTPFSEIADLIEENL